MSANPNDFEIDPPTTARPDPAHDPVTFSAEELREMEEGGLTLGDAIRAIEALPV